MTRTVCYRSFPDKRRRYVSDTLPAVLAAARAQDDPVFRRWLQNVWRDFLAPHFAPQAGYTVERLRALHDACRAGVYVEERDSQGELAACDEVRPLRQTVTEGGDCEDWAAVLLAGCRVLGVTGWLMTSGETHDPFLHIAVACRLFGRLYVMDPKGDAVGAPFDTRGEDYPILRFWANADGAAREIRLSPGWRVA